MKKDRMKSWIVSFMLLTSLLTTLSAQEFNEITKNNSKLIYSVHSDSLKYAVEIDGEYLWQDRYYHGSVDLCLYTNENRFYMSLEDHGQLGLSEAITKTFLLSEADIDPGNIFNNVYIGTSLSENHLYGIASMLSDSSIVFLINNVELGRSTAFKVEMEDLMLYL